MSAGIQARALAALALLAAAGRAQLATSGGFVLEDFSLDAAAGGMASPFHAAFVEIAAVAGAEMASPGYFGSIGFLEAHDPEPTNAPIVFGVAPALGSKAGGAAVSISGLHF